MFVYKPMQKTPRIKLNDNGFRYRTPLADKSRTHFNLHNLKNVLPNIVVNGIKTVERIVVAEDMDKKKHIDGKKRWELFMEGKPLEIIYLVQQLAERLIT